MTNPLENKLFDVTIYEPSIKELIGSIESITKLGVLISYKPSRSKTIITKLIPVSQIISIEGEEGTHGLIVYSPSEKNIKKVVRGYLSKSELKGFFKLIPENNEDPYYVRSKDIDITVTNSTKTLKKKKR